MQPVAYPKRPQFFANRFCRLMFLSRAASEMGPEAAMICANVAHTEDGKHYTGPVRFYSQDLADQCGISVSTLERARKRAVEAGWLHYEPGAKRRPATYWVTIPDHCREVADAPADRDEGEMLRQSDGASGEHPGSIQGASREKPPILRQADGESGGELTDHLPLPCPLPEPPTPRPAGGLVSIEPLTELLTEWAAAKLPGHDTPGGIRPTATRRGLWLQRLSDPRWAAEWREAVRRLGKSAKARGLSAGFARGVRLDDLLTKPDYLTRILEGEFDDSTSSRPPQPERWYDNV